MPPSKLVDVNDQKNSGTRELILSFKPFDKLKVESMIKNGQLREEDVTAVRDAAATDGFGGGGVTGASTEKTPMVDRVLRLRHYE